MSVAITNGYTDLATLKGYLSIPDGSFDDQLSMAINAASRGIDNYCRRRFWLDPTPVARTFVPDGLLYLAFGENDVFGGDIGVSTTVTVATDVSGRGVWDTLWASSDFLLLPVNAPAAWPEAKPWTAMRAVGTKTFPWLVNTWLTRLDRVKVTAQWGWPAVPADVTQACLIQAAKVFQRRGSPLGVAGFGEFGPVRLSRQMDSDVIDLLQQYIWQPVLVG